MKIIFAAVLIVLSARALPLGAQGKALVRTKTIPLAGVVGRIDHLAVDVQRQRLFLAALGNGSLEIIDLAKGERIHSLTGLKEPQGVAYVPAFDRIFVAGGGDGTLKVFDAQTSRLLSTAQFSSDADNVRYEAAENRIYVGYGEGAIAALDASTGRRLGEAQLPGHPESFQLERSSPRIFANVPTAHLIAVIDRRKMAVIARWPLVAARSNFPMALDEAHHRLFIGCRHPARLVVYDTEAGREVASFPSVGDTDDLFYDAQRARIYVSGGEGFVDVFEQLDPDHYRRTDRISTASGARTSLFIPQLGIFCVAVPRREGRAAEVQVYQAQR